MKLRCPWFNTYLVLLALLLAGCSTSREGKESGKQLALIRLHLEANQDGTDRNAPVPVFRERPLMVNINRDPFLDERSVVKASVVDDAGGFHLSVEFDYHGQLQLESVTGAYRGARIAINAQFSDGKTATNRWLAAPRITQRITSGVMSFTPDATREESELIVRGLNNLAVKIGNAPKPKKKK